MVPIPTPFTLYHIHSTSWALSLSNTSHHHFAQDCRASCSKVSSDFGVFVLQSCSRCCAERRHLKMLLTLSKRKWLQSRPQSGLDCMCHVRSTADVVLTHALFRGAQVHLTDINGSSQGHNMSLIVSYVPRSFDSGYRTDGRTLPGCAGALDGYKWLQPRPSRGLDCLICATLARQRILY